MEKRKAGIKKEKKKCVRITGDDSTSISRL
jgi:hypothetical protein